MPGTFPTKIAGRIRASLPELPSLTRTAEIPIYLIHNSPDPEDYFFLFDLELFAERSKAGVFVKPALHVWAGRSDFSRRAFARHLRETFAAEFDRLRRDLGRDKGRGWLSWSATSLGELAAVALGNIVLMAAFYTGRQIFAMTGLDRLRLGRSDRAALEMRIEGTQARVDAALEGLEVRLHRELYVHAYRGAARAGPMSGIELDAWPLPDHVRAHLEDRESSAWW